jgi:hypothetical protein
MRNLFILFILHHIDLTTLATKSKLLLILVAFLWPRRIFLVMALLLQDNQSSNFLYLSYCRISRRLLQSRSPTPPLAALIYGKEIPITGLQVLLPVLILGRRHQMYLVLVPILLLRLYQRQVILELRYCLIQFILWSSKFLDLFCFFFFYLLQQ